jgi:hypothetical protein
MAFEILGVPSIAGVLQRIKIHDLMAAMDDQTPDEMRTNEPRSSRDKNVHASSSLFAPLRLTS